MNTAIYTRVSTEDQAVEGVSLKMQEGRCFGYLDALGFSVIERGAREDVDVYIDDGVSASKVDLKYRPAGAQLVAAIQAGTVQRVVVLKLDRLWRDAMDGLATIADWRKRGVELHVVDLGGNAINLATAHGWLMLFIHLGLAQFESLLTGERTAAAMQHLKANGRRYTSTVYGFDAVVDGAGEDGQEKFVLAPNKEEQDVIALMQGWREDGFSLQTIADRLNHRGIPAKRGGKWGKTSVRSVLNLAGG